MKIGKLIFSSLLALTTISLSACNIGGGKTSKSDAEQEKIDYVAQAKLSDYFTGYDTTNFLDNGVGQVTLWNPVDGDTAHFYQVKETDPQTRLVKVRFYGIDTPESTGQIEPWGKKASKFTTEKLNNAGTIILTKGELTQTPADVDSTGTRFKGLVWVAESENAPLDEFRCLNLWIVQEGFSNGKGVAECPLADLFNKADLQAQKLKINMWSGDDPDFYKGSATVTSIHEIMKEFSTNNGSCPTYEGKKVSISGVVGKVVDTDAYVIEDYENEETGEIERYGLFIFAGYKYYEPLTTVGNDLTITGTFTVRYGNPQITSVSYNKYLPSDDDIKINRTNVDVPFDVKTFADVDSKYQYVNMINQFKHLHATGEGYDAIDKTTKVKSGAMNIELQDDAGNKMYLRVPKNVKFRIKGGGSLDYVETYSYLSANNLYIDLTAAIAVYDPANGDDDGVGTNKYWQLTLCDGKDIVYVDA